MPYTEVEQPTFPFLIDNDTSPRTSATKPEGNNLIGNDQQHLGIEPPATVDPHVKVGSMGVEDDATPANDNNLPFVDESRTSLRYADEIEDDDSVGGLSILRPPPGVVRPFHPPLPCKNDSPPPLSDCGHMPPAPLLVNRQSHSVTDRATLAIDDRQAPVQVPFDDQGKQPASDVLFGIAHYVQQTHI